MIGARTALSASWAGVIQKVRGRTRTAGLRPAVFGMKNAEGVFPLSPRGRSGERAGERGTEKRPPLPGPLLLFWGGEGEWKRCCAPNTICRTVLVRDHQRPFAKK